MTTLGFQKLSYEAGNKSYQVHILKLKGSSLVVINDESLTMTNLAVTMKTKFDKRATSCPLLGEASNMQSSTNMAQLLSTKTETQVFVTCDLSDEDYMNLMGAHGKKLFSDIVTVVTST